MIRSVFGAWTRLCTPTPWRGGLCLSGGPGVEPGGGYTRIRGELFHVGHELGRSTIQRILSDHGIEPSPERKGRMRWKTFLKAHWEVIAAADFCAAHCRVSRLLMDSC